MFMAECHGGHVPSEADASSPPQALARPRPLARLIDPTTEVMSDRQGDRLAGFATTDHFLGDSDGFPHAIGNRLIADDDMAGPESRWHQARTHPWPGLGQAHGTAMRGPHTAINAPSEHPPARRQIDVKPVGGNWWPWSFNRARLSRTNAIRFSGQPADGSRSDQGAASPSSVADFPQGSWRWRWFRSCDTRSCPARRQPA